MCGIPNKFAGGFDYDYTSHKIMSFEGKRRGSRRGPNGTSKLEIAAFGSVPGPKCRLSGIFFGVYPGM